MAKRIVMAPNALIITLQDAMFGEIFRMGTGVRLHAVHQHPL